MCCLVDYEDDEWPEDLGDSGLTVASRLASAAVSGSTAVASETHVQTARCQNTLKRTEAAICNIGAMLASVVIGFDVQSNTFSSSMTTPDFADNLSAAKVRHATDFSKDYNGSVGQHHTYHGCQTRYRPTVNFNLPIRFTESSYDDYCNNHDVYMTPSSDHHTTSSADSRRTTPSLSGRSFFSADSNCQSPPSNKQSVTDSASCADLALISLSPSTDEAFVECQRQFSDTGWAVVDTSTWTPKSTPKCQALRCEDVGYVQTSSSHQSPSVSSYCLASDALASPCAVETDNDSGSQCLAGIPNPICPPPVSRRLVSHEQHGLAERPVTLDIIARPRPLPGILKNASPIHVTPYSSPRSRVTPSSDSCTTYAQSPYHIVSQHRLSLSADHRKTLLDIDAEGQNADSTKPLSVTRLSQEPDVTE